MKKLVLSKHLLPLLILLFITTISKSTVFQTTTTGGLWNQGSTWVGGIPPSPTDDVEVYGDLSLNVNTSINNITIFGGATLQSASSGSYTLDILGNLVNHGTIQNNFYSLYLNLFGNITHDGIWQNQSSILYGTGTQYINATTAISCPVFRNNVQAKTVNIQSANLHFVGSNVDWGGCTITFGYCTLVCDGGYFYNADVICNQFDITLNSGAYIQYINCSTNYVWMRGTFNTGHNVAFTGNGLSLTAEVVDVLQNFSSNYASVSIDGNLLNNGTIQNNFYNLTLNITGNLTNNGLWQNSSTNLTGAGNQTLTFNQPFDGTNLNNANTDGYLTADAMLVFNGTVFNLNNDTIYYTNYASPVTFNGGYMSNFTMIGGGSPDYVTIDLNSNAYFNAANIVFDEITLVNTYQFSSTMNFYGNVTVQGTLQNQGSNNYTATVFGNITNTGTIQNSSYSLSLYITGDIIQNGNWTNTNTYLSGAQDQMLTFNQPFDGTNLTNSNTAGKLLTNTDLVFNNVNIEMNTDTLVFDQSADNLKLDGSILKNCTTIRQGMKAMGDLTLNLVNDAYVQSFNVEADSIILQGVYQFVSPMNFYGNVAVQDTLRNNGSNNYAASVNGNLTNNGTITNNYFSLALNISGNITHNGVWNNSSTYLTGITDQTLVFNHDFDGANLTNLDTDGKIITRTNLTFNNTDFDMSNDTLVFAGPADSLTYNGNVLNNVKIIRDDVAKISGTMKFVLTNNAYIYNMYVFAGDIRLYGVFQFISPMYFYGNVYVMDVFQNQGSNSYTANFNANLINKGSILNNYYNLTLNIAGDIWQQGTWSCNNTNMTGDSDQNLWFDNAFNGQNLTNANTNGKIIAQTDMILNSTNFEMNNDTLEFAGVADSLSVNGNVFKDAVVIRENTKVSGSLGINVTGGAYVQNQHIFADAIDLFGTFQFVQPMDFHGDVTVSGLFRNNGSNSYSAYIFGNLINNGSIANNYYTLSMYLDGDITQNGNWSCGHTYLISSSTQTIHQTQPFIGSTFTDNDGSSDNVTTSDLVFENIDVNLNGATLTMPQNAVLAVKNGNFINADVSTDGIEIYMDDGHYMENMNLMSPTLTGVVQVRNNVAFSGHTFVKGTLENSGANSYTLNVNGSIENQGTIQDNYYQFHMYVQEDILNNGNWTNTWTQLEGNDGSINQTVELQDGHYITGQLKLFSNNSTNFLWYKDNNPLTGNPDYSGVTSQVLTFLVPADNVRAGLYNCSTLAGWSRNINIVTTTSAYPQLDLTVMLEGPFNGTDMNTDLNASGNLPLTQPYDAFPNNYFGPENVVSIPSADVVDWLLIEFRDAVDGNNATQSTRVDRQPAFLLSDGSVVGLDGSSLLTVPHNFTNNMFVLVHHRNHLGIMSAIPLNESGGVYSYDFAYDTWNAYGGPNATKNIGTDLSPVYGMMGGDGNGDGMIDAVDHQQWPAMAGTQVGYEQTDYNLDGQIDNQDKNDSWIENIGASEQYPQ